jgi:hypothetical protein
MNGVSNPRALRRRLIALLEAGFEVMARYPYDMTELHWNSDLYDPPQDGEDRRDQGGPRKPSRPYSGRSIKLVPPPASQRYQAARPTRIPGRRSGRKQPV